MSFRSHPNTLDVLPLTGSFSVVLDVLANSRLIANLLFISKVLESGPPAEEQCFRCFSPVLELSTAQKQHLFKLLMIL